MHAPDDALGGALAPAALTWRGDAPFSRAFDDIYYSEDAAAEVARVFLQPGEVLDTARRQPLVTVAELGFGTGLNFVVTAQAVLAHTNARLHFISCEAHPLDAPDWRRLGTLRGATWPLAQALADTPLPLLPGWHQRRFADGRVLLSVYHGTAEAMFDALATDGAVDAFFLDGFAPDRNPAMWSPALFQAMTRCAGSGSTVATFTAAGAVRRALAAAGWEMRKVDQRPHKRESLAGRLSRPGRAASPAPRSVHVHGAGLAGAAMARHCAEAGHTVRVSDPAGIAGGASCISRAVLHARLLGDGSAAAAFRARAFHYASAFATGRNGVATSGCLQLTGPTLTPEKLDRITGHYAAPCFWLERLSADVAGALAGIRLDSEGLYFPTAATVNIAVLCRDLLAHPAIEVASAAEPMSPGAANVLCNGTAARTMAGLDWLELADVYGQLDHLARPEDAPGLPVVGRGYVVPGDTTLALGATYEYQPWAEDEATARNVANNAHLGATTTWAAGWRSRERGARSVSSDRFPAIGRVADDVWVSTGHGSMGTTGAPFAAALIEAEISGRLMPASPAELAVVGPQRFQERQARRGLRHGVSGPRSPAR